MRSTLVGVYTLSGFCSALAGVVFTFYMLSGYGLHAVGMELDAIAAVVIGARCSPAAWATWPARSSAC